MRRYFMIGLPIFLLLGLALSAYAGSPHCLSRSCYSSLSAETATFSKTPVPPPTKTPCPSMSYEDCPNQAPPGWNETALAPTRTPTLAWPSTEVPPVAYPLPTPIVIIGVPPNPLGYP